MGRTVLRLPEIAAMTGVPVNTLRSYRYRGDGGPRMWKLAGRVVAYEDDVRAWIDDQAAEGTSDVSAFGSGAA